MASPDERDKLHAEAREFCMSDENRQVSNKLRGEF
jgi:hypothetical protein